MTKIALLGDVHGDYSWMRFVMKTIEDLGISQCVQVGDFGIGNRDANLNFLNNVNKLGEKHNVIVDVVPGNHENWDYINKQFAGSRTDVWEVGAHLRILPRGYRWEQDGLSFLALGGAPSVDRMWRVEEQKGVKNTDFHYWWPAEILTQEDVDYAVEGGYADVMIGHDVPHGVREIEDLISGNPHGFHVADLLYAEDGRKLITEAWMGVMPKFYIGGHYHPAYGVQETLWIPDSGGYKSQITVLGCNNQPGALAVLDTETQEVGLVHLGQLYREFAQGLKGWNSYLAGA